MFVIEIRGSVNNSPILALAKTCRKPGSVGTVEWGERSESHDICHTMSGQPEAARRKYAARPVVHEMIALPPILRALLNLHRGLTDEA